jgi:hypothetical protein
MKRHWILYSLLVIGLTLAASCDKEDPPIPNPRPTLLPAPVPVTPVGPVAHGNQDYFWGYPWSKTSAGYEIKLRTDRLTQDAINKGIKVHVAIWTEMSTFFPIPSRYYETLQQAYVELSYTAAPGELLVLAKAPFEVKYESDLFIEYQ